LRSTPLWAIRGQAGAGGGGQPPYRFGAAAVAADYLFAGGDQALGQGGSVGPDRDDSAGHGVSPMRLFRAGSHEGASVVELSEAVGIRRRGSYAAYGNKEA
jgi:hypothetical protein